MLIIVHCNFKHAHLELDFNNQTAHECAQIPHLFVYVCDVFCGEGNCIVM